MDDKSLGSLHTSVTSASAENALSKGITYPPRLLPKFETSDMEKLKDIATKNEKSGWRHLKDNYPFISDPLVSSLSSLHGLQKATNYIEDLAKEPTIY